MGDFPEYTNRHSNGVSLGGSIVARFYLLARWNRHVHNCHIFQKKMYDFLTVISQNYGKSRTPGQLIGLTDGNISVIYSRKSKLNRNINMFPLLQMMKYSMVHIIIKQEHSNSEVIIRFGTFMLSVDLIQLLKVITASGFTLRHCHKLFVE